MKETKSKIVREMLSKGIGPKEAASLSGATLQYVYDIKSKMNREKANPTPRVKEEFQPDQQVTKLSNEVFQTIRDQEDQIHSLKEQVDYMAVVISYLENRLDSSAYGAAI